MKRAVVAVDGQRWISPEPLNLAPELVGAPLGTPARRALAMALDLLVVAMLTGVSGLWLWVGLGLVLLQLRARQRSAPPGRRAIVGWVGAALVLLLAVQEAEQRWDNWRHPEATTAAAKAEQAEDLAEATEALRKVSQVEMPAAASAALAIALEHAASAAAAASAAKQAASGPEVNLRRRVRQLERELAEARQPLRLKERVMGLLDEIGAGLGWGIVYFSLLPAWWGGQTVGKKVMRLRVVELTGKPMTVMRNLKRYGGYAAGLATGGLGFLQILWDPNRQGLHDKAAHTAVLDLRGTAAGPPPEPGPETG